MSKRMKNILLFIIIFVALLLLGFVCFFSIKSLASNKVTDKKDLIVLQNEKKFESKGYTFNNPNVILNPYGISPLTALIIFETNKEEKIKITIEGKDTNTTYTHIFPKGKKHYLEVYGLYPNKNNRVIIETENNKKDIFINTDKLPEDFVLPLDVKAEKSKLSNELYFYSPATKGYTCAYDINGDVRWYLKERALWKMDRLSNGHLLLSTEKLVNPPYYSSGLYEMDMLGKIYHEYRINGGYHHDYFELENGNLIVASNDFNNEFGTVEDFIVELDRETGKIVKEIDLKNILKMDDGKSDSWTDYDWFHNNSVWYDKKTNSLTLSGRHKDAIVNIDYDSLKLNWIIGDSTNWDKKYQKYFFNPIGDNFEWQWSQHAAMITPEGNVFVLDNGNNKSKLKDKYVGAENSYTRGVMYEINTNDMTIKQIYQYGKERGSNYYSPYISDVDYLDKDHYIIHSGGISYKNGKILNIPAGLGNADVLRSITTELLNDEVIFEIILPTNNYRVEKMSLYSSDKYRNKKGTKLGSLGISKVDDQKVGPIINYKNIDSEYNSHKIKLVKESDRLVVNGTFKRGTNVDVILYKNLTSNIYNLSVSKKPYTALCVDIPTKEETKNGLNVTKYINKNGLLGRYEIYIKINDALYKTNEYVVF